jgi:ABC-2 type transport system permease protein/lipopolysaccharide transport system permease protein
VSAAEPDPSGHGALVVTDVAAIPDEAPRELIYHHKVNMMAAARRLWRAREVMYTLAERDFRVQYKQASLGVMWALLTPLLTLAIMVVVFSRAKTFGTEGLPFALFAFVGILCWSFFAGTLGSGGSSLLANKALLAKTQFPRECFPLETMGVQALNTVLTWIPLAILFVIFGRAPAITTLWAPMFMLIEVLFAAGVTLAAAGMIIQMRDLAQVLPILISLGLFVEPVIWPLSRLPAWILPYYSFFNPLGPVIDNVRRTMLLGLEPDWKLIGLAALGTVMYIIFGYRIFKRLEVSFADVA